MISSGMSLLRALYVIEEQTENEKLKDAGEDVSDAVKDAGDAAKEATE